MLNRLMIETTLSYRLTNRPISFIEFSLKILIL